MEDTKRFNENLVQLKPTTKFFEIDKYIDAVLYAKEKRSYVGSTYEVGGELIGWYVPA